MIQTSKKLLGAIAALLFIGSACTKKFLETDDQKAAKADVAAIEAYAAANNLALQKTAQGLYYTITKTNPAGTTAKPGDQAVFYYNITLLDGAVFDSVINRPPLRLNVSANGVIAGINEAIGLLKTGEKGTFLIPSALAFGAQSSAKLPANSVLRADIELVDLRSEDKQIDVYIAENAFKNVEKTASGLRYISTSSSTGSAVADGDQVVLKYAGKLLNGAQFDAGEFSFTIGSAQGPIKGFEEGVKKMRVGEKATIVFPSSIGYGDQGRSPSIAPFSPLVFELELVSKRAGA